ncbi:MAG: hypothetical protein Q8P21_01510 [bacterium]|nr:hypothetical protein [bacterium]
MEQSQNKKIVSVIIIIVLILGAGYLLLGKYRAPGEVNQQAPTDSGNQELMVVAVENTPMVRGVLSTPARFPTDIPLEKEKILESATTRYPDQNAQQLSASYQSSKTITEKYAEYKNYMTGSGYQITESPVDASVRAIFGVKEDANLTVAISSSGGGTLVQLSYLLK